MTNCRLKPGVCGHDTLIRTGRVSRDMVSIDIETECEAVQKFAGQIPSVDWKSALTRIDRSVIYTEAAKYIKHTACPVPFAVLKAIEVEMGLALPRDVTLEFLPSETA